MWSATADEQDADVYRKHHPRRAQGRNIPRGALCGALTAVMQTHTKRQNYLILSSDLWNTNGTRHGSGGMKDNRKRERDGP